ncbi:hypothetical protein CYMTET_30377 [Cymbomonas tetramitiformis]|uniref:DNA repair endonuclease XPF n=1 Tax=Cymbomonas tetramitiformis TaxID=36881 RepID=A0AAE0FJ43_9CHLO|nr:hypothetical protein CYMTET_30377 [Cymbomonas tetramitiformis]
MPLRFYEEMVGELLQEDGLCVLASGLGVHKVLTLLYSQQTEEQRNQITFLVGFQDWQKVALIEEFRAQGCALPLPQDVSTELSSAERLVTYAGGGWLFVTTRILVVDLLSQRVPLRNTAGLIVANAHRITESCGEAFIARLLKEQPWSGHIYGFSDSPQYLSSGFNKVERVLRSLYLPKVYLWPRFHVSVSEVLEAHVPEVIEMTQPLTSSIQAIQEGLLEVMGACLNELRRSRRVDCSELVLENGLFKSFDTIVQRQLDPIWHTVSKRMKQMVYDLRTLRKLAGYLLRYDAITFLQYLETLRASETVNSVWLYATAASDIFEHAKRRVYLLHRANASAADRKRKRAEAPAAGSEVGRSELEAVLEPMPKWALLRDILREIKEELRQQGEQPGGSGAPQVCDVVLVSKDLATGQQLLRVIAEGEEEVMNAKFHKYLAHRAELQQKRLRQRGGKGRGRGRGRGKGKGEPVGVNTASVAYQFADKAMKAGQLAEGEAAALVAEAKAVERTERGAGPRAGQRGSGEVGSRGGQGSRGSRTQGEEKGGSRGVGTGEKAKAVARPETTSTAGNIRPESTFTPGEA